ncbi:hypothetical protein D3C83_49870 [compost metagenome]
MNCSAVMSGSSRRWMVASVMGRLDSPSTIRAYSTSARSIMRAAMSMPFMKARQALPTSKLRQFSFRPRLPCTMQAVEGSR